MFLRRCSRRKNSGKEYIYWQLVESYRNALGQSRQRVIAHLGSLSKPACEGIKLAAEDRCFPYRLQLFDEDLTPEYAQIDTQSVQVERSRDFGGPWLALHLMGLLGLNQLFWDVFPPTRASVCWPAMAIVLIVCRLCTPSSELQIADCLYERSALEDLLGLPAHLVNDDRLYRSLDKLLVHKDKLETHLKNRLGELFGLSYDLLLYDVTSTFIEGKGLANPQMKRGYSRDQRSDCKQVCIGLVVSRCGMPLGYEVFDGNRSDVTTVEDIVKLMEKRYGKADRIWVMDRGMLSERNLEFLRQDGRRYILGGSRALLKTFEAELRNTDWHTIRVGLSVKKCLSEDGKEAFILCRSVDRQAKEEAIHAKFEKQIEEGLKKIVAACKKRKLSASVLDRRVGALLAKNSRARRLFDVQVNPRDGGGCDVVWKKNELNDEWSKLSEGCYVLRSNITDWSEEDLWHAYIQLTEAETAFRIQKNDLQLRPIWHQKKERVQAHILVCFLAYVLWKTFGQLCKRAGLGDEPRKVFDEISQIQMVDVVMQTVDGTQIRRRCIANPEEHQKVLLTMLQLKLPKQLRFSQM
jgi:transposase